MAKIKKNRESFTNFAANNIKTMKNRSLFLLFALLPLLFAACTQGTPPHSSDAGTPAAKKPDSLPMTPVAVERDFTQINNLSNVDILWSEGPCRIGFEGNKMLLNDLDITVDDAGLTVNELHPIAPSLTARLHVSSPTLTLLSNYNSATIRLAGCLRTESLEIGNMVEGCIDADTLLCQRLKYTAEGTATALFRLIRADEAALIADGNGTTDATLDVGHLVFHAWGTQRVTLRGHADTKDMSCSRTNMVNDLLK